MFRTRNITIYLSHIPAPPHASPRPTYQLPHISFHIQAPSYQLPHTYNRSYPNVSCTKHHHLPIPYPSLPSIHPLYTLCLLPPMPASYIPTIVPILIFRTRNIPLYRSPTPIPTYQLPHAYIPSILNIQNAQYRSRRIPAPTHTRIPSILNIQNAQHPPLFHYACHAY